MTDKTKILSPRSEADVPVADLSYLYEARDPRAYYTTLEKLDYQTPGHIQNAARQCLEHFVETQPDMMPWIVDIGCGYGANGAGLLYDVSIRTLLKRYSNTRMNSLTPDDVIEQDTLFFVLGPRHPYRIAGLDISRNALDYGLSTGVLDQAFDDDLTQSAVPAKLADIMRSGPLILESGVPVYVLPGILDNLLGAASRETPPWIITAPPRYTNVAEYAGVLADHGYGMEKITAHPLRHRRFHSEEEGHRIMSQQTEMGLDNQPEQATGYIHVDLYLARPGEPADGRDGFTPTAPAWGRL